MALQSNGDLIEGILSKNSKLRNTAFYQLYKECFKVVKFFVLKNSGNIQEAEDVFQDGVMVLYQNLKAGKFKGEASVTTYFINICKYIHLGRLRKNNALHRPVDIKDVPESYSNNQSVIDPDSVKGIMNELKEDCQKLLTAFYYEHKSMKEIKTLFGLSSEQVAKTKKLRCMKALMEIVNKRKLTLENFQQ